MLRHSTVYVTLISVCNGIYQYLALCVWLVMEAQAVEGGEDVECRTVCVWEMEKQKEENQDFFCCRMLPHPPPPASGCSEYVPPLHRGDIYCTVREKRVWNIVVFRSHERGVNEKGDSKKNAVVSFHLFGFRLPSHQTSEVVAGRTSSCFSYL